MVDHDTIEAFPLHWPSHVPRSTNRERAKFGRQQQNYRQDGTPSWKSKTELTIEQARQRVEHELALLGARDVVISSNLRLRNDGAPMSKQRQPDDPGVAVYFQLTKAPHCMPCDRWDRAADNLAAIAKHIESLRGQLRWGVVDVAQAFAGFKAPPPAGGTSASSGPLWHDVLQVPPTAALEFIKTRYRELAQKHHPDRGGDAGAMAVINRAWEQAQAARAS